MEYSRPPNPTPSKCFQCEHEVENSNSSIVFVDDFQKDSGGGAFAYILRNCGSKQNFGTQPSLSDLIKEKLVTIDGTGQYGLNRKPSLSDLMDFEISPTDLVSESTALPPNGDSMSRDYFARNRDKRKGRRISPLARLGHRKYTLPKNDVARQTPSQHIPSPPKR